MHMRMLYASIEFSRSYSSFLLEFGEKLKGLERIDVVELIVSVCQLSKENRIFLVFQYDEVHSTYSFLSALKHIEHALKALETIETQN